MALDGCRCVECRRFVSGEKLLQLINATPKPLPPDQQDTLEQIVRDAYAKTKPLNGEGKQ